MSKHNINASQTLYTLIRILDNDNDGEVIYNFSRDSEVYKNSLNLKTLKKLAEDHGKSIRFEAEDSSHKDYIDAVNGDYIEFNDEEVNLNDVNVHSRSSVLSKLGGLGSFLNLGKSSAGGYQDESESSSTSFSYASRKKLLRRIAVPIIILLLIVGAVWAFWWYVPTAEVKVTVDSQGLIKLIDITASLNQTEVSPDSKRIPAFKVETSETDSQTIPTTGKKQVGEVATGKVTITNKTNKTIEIDKGTTLKLISSDKDSLLYETTEDVEIKGYSESTDPDIGKVYEKKDVSVKAFAFGGQYNLEDTEKFEVDDYDTDEVLAENLEDIDGGSSEEVNVVAQSDLDSLKRTMEEFMKEKVERALSQRLVSGQVMQESSIVFEVVKAEYNYKLEDESDDLTLTMTMTGSVLAYDEKALDSLMKEVVNEVVPESFTLNGDKLDYEVAATSVKDGTDVNLQVKLTSSVTPNLDTEKIKQDLSGMTIDQAQEYMNNVNDIKGFEISVSPKMPGSLLQMPQRADNIEVVVSR